MSRPILENYRDRPLAASPPLATRPGDSHIRHTPPRKESLPDRDKGPRPPGLDDRPRGGPPRRRGPQGAARFEGLFGARSQGRAARPRAHRGREELGTEVSGATRSRPRAPKARASRLCARRASGERHMRAPPSSLAVLLASLSPAPSARRHPRRRAGARVHRARRPAALAARRGLRGAVLGRPVEGARQRRAARGAGPRPLGGDAHRSAGTERILPPGTAVRIREIEFPTGWIIARRVVMTPRYHPWVMLEVPGRRPPARDRALADRRDATTTSAARSSGSSPRTIRASLFAERCRRSTAPRS